MTEYNQGGCIPGGLTLAVIHPDECIITRDGVCRRAGHPTPTSDGNRPGAPWRCDGKP